MLLFSYTEIFQPLSEKIIWTIWLFSCLKSLYYNIWSKHLVSPHWLEPFGAFSRLISSFSLCCLVVYTLLCVKCFSLSGLGKDLSFIEGKSFHWCAISSCSWLFEHTDCQLLVWHVAYPSRPPQPHISHAGFSITCNLFINVHPCFCDQGYPLLAIPDMQARHVTHRSVSLSLSTQFSPL